ncbi:MAG: phosphohydrolase [Planctomycetota bacterium]
MTKDGEINISRNRVRIEQMLERYRDVIGADYAGYRNHVYRTVTYAMHFLDGDVDAEPSVETAMVYHDIGLWTDKQLAYLEPSEDVVVADNERYGWKLDANVLRGIIHWHHKMTRYRGPHERIIEACRKADWVDASKGWLRKGLKRKMIAAVEAAFPNEGFHKALLRLAKDYGGSTLIGGIRVTRGIVKW